MKTIRFIPLILALFGACAVPRDTTRAHWYPHQPAFWRTTPGGHQRDDGPFSSVLGGFVTDAEIDAAIDAGYAEFARVFPGLPLSEHPIALNDDYAMFVPTLGLWASGLEVTGQKMINVCLWSRIETPADPGPAFIVRPPGNYWGVDYTNWRSTGRPLAPALMHELLHAAIGDPGHKDPRWSLVH